MIIRFFVAGSIKREKSTVEAENSKLKDKVRDLQQHLHAMRTSQAEQNKFHHETVQAKKEIEVCFKLNKRYIL